MYKLKKGELAFAKIRPTAKIPTKKDEDAGYDVYADFSEDYLIIHPHSTELVPTGIASAVAPGYALIVEERGSTGSRGIKKSAGVIDSGYRGEIFIALTNTNSDPVVILKDDTEVPESVLQSFASRIQYPYSKAIAQLRCVIVPEMTVTELTYDELKEIPSERGTGKLGESGK